MRQIAITDFDFTTFPADQDNLIKAWLPEIEESARSYVPDDRFIAFLIAALRIGARSKSLDGFNLMQIVEKAGYSRSTFFRLFEGYSGFLLNGYKLTCDLSIRVYERHLGGHERTLDEFVNLLLMSSLVLIALFRMKLYGCFGVNTHWHMPIFTHMWQTWRPLWLIIWPKTHQHSILMLM